MYKPFRRSLASLVVQWSEFYWPCCRGTRRCTSIKSETTRIIAVRGVCHVTHLHRQLATCMNPTNAKFNSSCYSTDNDSPYRCHGTYHSIEFARWGQYALHLIHGFWGLRKSVPKGHVDRLNRFCRARSYAQETDRQTQLHTETDHAALRRL